MSQSIVKPTEIIDSTPELRAVLLDEVKTMLAQIQPSDSFMFAMVTPDGHMQSRYASSTTAGLIFARDALEAVINGLQREPEGTTDFVIFALQDMSQILLGLAGMSEGTDLSANQGVN